jgi:hypothetical protein
MTVRMSCGDGTGGHFASGRPSASPQISTCVSRWSKLGTMWEGVSLDTLLNEIADDAAFAHVRSFGGYTTNLPLEDQFDGHAWVAFNFDGEDLWWAAGYNIFAIPLAAGALPRGASYSRPPLERC